MLCISHIIEKDAHWIGFLEDVEKLIDKYSNIDIGSMGFPEDWKTYLYPQQSKDDEYMWSFLKRRVPKTSFPCAFRNRLLLRAPSIALIKNHCMIDGNKRIGTHAMLVFLAINGIEVDFVKYITIN